MTTNAQVHFTAKRSAAKIAVAAKHHVPLIPTAQASWFVIRMDVVYLVLVELIAVAVLRDTFVTQHSVSVYLTARLVAPMSAVIKTLHQTASPVPARIRQSVAC